MVCVFLIMTTFKNFATEMGIIAFISIQIMINTFIPTKIKSMSNHYNTYFVSGKIQAGD